jgi:hypothetical protein
MTASWDYGNEELPARGWQVTLSAMKPEIDPKLLNDPLFKELMAEGLAMQDRFSAEPVYAKTGRGYLKSAGVAEVEKAKAARQPKQPS